MATELDRLTKRLLQKKSFRAAYEKLMTDVFYRVGRMVKEARVMEEMSQAALAKKLKTHQSVIARIESGKMNVSLGFLNKIAKALGTRLLPPRFESLKAVEDEHDKCGYSSAVRTKMPTSVLCKQPRLTLAKAKKSK